ncbi:MAG TPA: hypothetical protein VF468_11755 [Actinomycetota bacterium]|nr:hypothetical protein [Actinomycetota bacterium]
MRRLLDRLEGHWLGELAAVRLPGLTTDRARYKATMQVAAINGRR